MPKQLAHSYCLPPGIMSLKVEIGQNMGYAIFTDVVPKEWKKPVQQPMGPTQITLFEISVFPAYVGPHGKF